MRCSSRGGASSLATRGRGRSRLPVMASLIRCWLYGSSPEPLSGPHYRAGRAPCQGEDTHRGAALVKPCGTMRPDARLAAPPRYFSPPSRSGSSPRFRPPSRLRPGRPSLAGGLSRAPRGRLGGLGGRPRAGRLRASVPWLVDAELAAAGQPQLRQHAPALILGRLADHTVRTHPPDEGLDVVAHEVELVHVVLVGRVHGDLRRRQPEDEPALTHVHVG